MRLKDIIEEEQLSKVKHYGKAKEKMALTLMSKTLIPMIKGEEFTIKRAKRSITITPKQKNSKEPLKSINKRLQTDKDMQRAIKNGLKK